MPLADVDDARNVRRVGGAEVRLGQVRGDRVSSGLGAPRRAGDGLSPGMAVELPEALIEAARIANSSR